MKQENNAALMSVLSKPVLLCRNSPQIAGSTRQLHSTQWRLLLGIAFASLVLGARIGALCAGGQ